MRGLWALTITALLSSGSLSVQAQDTALVQGPLARVYTKTNMPIAGYWEGVIAYEGVELRINVEFTNQPDGLKASIDIPDLYILGYKLNNVSYQGSKVNFVLPLGSQHDTFDGTFDGKVISGNYFGRLYQTTTSKFSLKPIMAFGSRRRRVNRAGSVQLLAGLKQ